MGVTIRTATLFALNEVEDGTAFARPLFDA